MDATKSLLYTSQQPYLRRLQMLICLIGLLSGVPSMAQSLSDWAHAVNQKDTSKIAALYSEQGIKVITAVNILGGVTDIASFYDKADLTVTKEISRFSVLANAPRYIDYEVVEFHTKNNKEFLQLQIWRKSQEQRLIDFEYTTTLEAPFAAMDTTELNQRREQWIRLCNAHDASALVREMYTSNTLYYNHKPLRKGVEELSQAYSYMNREQYRLTLTPLSVIPANADTVFEIGQCSGSYNGKYILIWKQEDGKWKIFIDSNV